MAKLQVVEEHAPMSVPPSMSTAFEGHAQFPLFSTFYWNSRRAQTHMPAMFRTAPSLRTMVRTHAPCLMVTAGETPQIRSYATQRHQKLILAAQKRNRQRKLEKPPEKDKLAWMKSRKLLVGPRRETYEDRLKEPPLDDVFYTDKYMPTLYPTAEAIAMHRETHHPTVLDDPDALLYAFVELSLKTKKKTKFREDFSGTVLYNHPFSITKREKRIIALCKSTDLASESLEAGAEVAGGTTVIKRILTGELDTKHFDYILAHVDIMQDLPQLRGLLKTKLPLLANGKVTNDLPGLVRGYFKGIDFTSKSDKQELDYGFVEVPVGKLSMPTEHLMDNIRTLLIHIDGFKPKGTDPGTFITKVELKCPPTTEKFMIACSEFLDHYADEEEDVAVKVNQ
ncbi:mitochondrial ribosomal protein L1 isoform X1 [Dermacentor variabilis]|uniref:mitochondrial ribosomal protein L1 isoform X1 n=1 Tax=Dermacentor variabilis TaxID=34621 RepID=UPI003F5BBFC0